MARGRGGKMRKFANTKVNNRKEERQPNKRQYEEYGEAHPIDEKEAVVKRLKVEDSEDTHPQSDEDGEGLSSEEEDGEEDALSTLLATFNTQSGKAVDSDDDDDDDDEEEEGGEEEEEEEEEEQQDDDDEEKDDMLECSEGDDDDESDESDAGDVAESEEEKVMEKDTQEYTDSRAQDDNSGDEDCEGLESREQTNDSSDEEDKCTHSQRDPFSSHFEQNLNELCAEQVRNKTKWTSTFQKWSTLGRIKVEVPKVEVETSKPLLLAEENEADDPPAIGLVAEPPNLEQFSLKDYHIRKNLRDNVAFTSDADGVIKCPTGLTNLQKELLCAISSYSDLYFPEASHEHWEEVRTIYTLHAVNHVLKTRKRIMNHNAKIKSRKKKKSVAVGDTHRDQGYTRPKVLILLPFKHSAYLVVEILMVLLLKGSKTHVQNYNRFKQDYGPGGAEEEEEGKRDKLSRPEDFTAIFKGDTNEDFKLGLQVTKNSVKLYADFYQSDIILASPLGLRYIMGSNSRTDIQTDFLTSIEVLILDQADIFMMQNWEHILVLMEAINKPPHDVHKLNTDLTRVRLWSLEGHASLYRQTLVFSATNIDHHRALISKCYNFTGRMEVLNPGQGGSVEEVVVHTDLIINNIPGMRDPDARFRHFTTELLPRLRAEQRSHTLVYIPDYCDYVRLLRHLKEDGGTSIASINEYMVGQNNKVAKIRSLFFDGHRHFLLYTERFHFYRRYRIKGVRHVIFYDLPTYPHFFSEICNLMVESNQNRRSRKQHMGSTVTMLVQKSNLTRLVGILGPQRTADILSSGNTVHTCVLGK